MRLMRGNRVLGAAPHFGCRLGVLGRGAIFWAEELGATVTAVTIAPAHVELVRRLAAQAGVADRVAALLSDATTPAGAVRLDGVIAVDSSSSFPRSPWFQRLAGLLRPGGRVFISDGQFGA
jgi:tocopherol O-methyltransferase